MNKLLGTVSLLVVAAAGIWLLDPWAEDPTPDPSTVDLPGSSTPPEKLRGDVEPDDAEPSESSQNRVEMDRTSAAPPPADAEASPHPLTILVRDAAERPAPNIPVCMAVQLGHGWRVLWRGRTTAEGSARIDDVRDEAEQYRENVVVAVNLPSTERARRQIDPDDPPREPVVFTLPPLGRVEVVLEHPEDSLLSGARVRIANAEAERRDVPGDVQVVHETSGGRALIDVALGLSLRVTGQLEASNLSRDKVIEGPRSSGETVLVHLDMRAQKPMLVARLRDEDGAWVEKRSLDTKMSAERSGSSSSYRFSVRTDPAGWVRLELTDDLGDGAQRRLEFSDPRRGAAVRVEVPAVLQAGENHLGALTLKPPPLLCAGIVEDRSGKPIAGASIRIQRKKWHDRSKPQGFYWRSVDIPAVQTGAAGRFEVRGDGGDDELGISLSHKSYLPLGNQPFTTGARELRFVLDLGGALVGRLLLGEDLPRRSVSIRLALPGHLTDETSADADGRFRFDSLDPGAVDAEVRLYGRAEPVLVVSGITIRGGEDNVDPRLQDVDLTGDVRRIRFSIHDDAGGPIHDAMALMLSAGTKAKRFEGWFVETGRGDILATHAPLDLFVFAEGFCSETIQNLQDGQRIRLRPAQRLRVRVPAAVVAAAAPLVLVAQIRPEQRPFARGSRFELRGEHRTSSMSGGVPWSSALTGRVENGTVVLSVPSAGRHQLRWFLDEPRGGDRQPIQRDGEAVVESLDVVARAGEQVHTAGLRAEDVTGSVRGR